MPIAAAARPRQFVLRATIAAARADYDSALAVSRGNERGFFAPFRAYVSAYAGNAAGRIVQLNQLVTQADGWGCLIPSREDQRPLETSR